jgi:hypothetical protein
MPRENGAKMAHQVVGSGELSENPDSGCDIQRISAHRSLTYYSGETDRFVTEPAEAVEVNAVPILGPLFQGAQRR